MPNSTLPNTKAAEALTSKPEMIEVSSRPVNGLREENGRSRNFANCLLTGEVGRLRSPPQVPGLFRLSSHTVVADRWAAGSGNGLGAVQTAGGSPRGVDPESVQGKWRAGEGRVDSEVSLALVRESTMAVGSRTPVLQRGRLDRLRRQAFASTRTLRPHIRLALLKCAILAASLLAGQTAWTVWQEGPAGTPLTRR